MIHFHKTNEYLNNKFDTNNISLDLFFNYFLFTYFYENSNDYINKKTITINFIKKIREISDEFKENDEISMNEKIRALNSLFLTNGKLETMEDLNKLNLKYYYTSEAFENSIIDKVCKFFELYINCLNENSIVYENLLYIDGGYGYYRKETVYTYDLTNLATLKAHLKEIIPKIHIFCYMENDEIAFTASEFYGTVINVYHLLKNYQNINKIFKLDFNKPQSYNKIITEDELDDIAMNVALNYIHEIIGHRKNSLAEPGTVSPKKIINKNKELIELKHKEEYKGNINDNNEYILTSKRYKGDSGHFLELSYGKVDNILVTKLFKIIV